MDSYRLARTVLFRMDPESSHNLTLGLLARISDSTTLLKLLQRQYASKIPSVPVEAMGFRFSNPVGLAAGLDKDAVAGPALSALGFGFVELGTVTPLAQPGNPKPRMFRLEKDQAIINRMGFNSGGIDNFLNNLGKRRPNCITGINLGKNAATPIEQALNDYQHGMESVYTHADYISINISSPNTKDLRSLQRDDNFEALLGGLQDCRRKLQDKHQRNVPVTLKIAPDLDHDEIAHIATSCAKYGIDAIIATNTTVTRPENLDPRFSAENGGLSGRPLREKSTMVIETLYRELGNSIPIIGVGGIMCADDAVEKINAGARMVQIYSGLIYRGPALIREIVGSINIRK